MANPSDDAEVWWLDAPFGCGGVYTVGGVVIRGGASIFNRFVGQDIRKLSIKGHYTYEYIGVEPFESWRRCGWRTIRSS
jgi:hypothetical protein